MTWSAVKQNCRYLIKLSRYKFSGWDTMFLASCHAWVWNSTAREAPCPKNHPVLTPRLLNQFGHCSILCKEPNKIFLKFPSTSRSSARVLYFPAFLPTSHSGKMLPLVLAFDNLQGDHCIQSVTLHGMKEECNVYQNSVCFLIGAFGFIVTVVFHFRKCAPWSDLLWTNLVILNLRSLQTFLLQDLHRRGWAVYWFAAVICTS